jgi:hypothetical protein
VLTNRQAPETSAALEVEIRRTPFLARVLEAFDACPEPFQIDPRAEGFDLAPLEDSEPGRCRLKIFTPREGKERLCVFFYKRSNLAWSRDRFSYGGVEFRPEQATDEDVRSWRAWLLSGFDPERRPPRWRRAFLFDVPE